MLKAGPRVKAGWLDRRCAVQRVTVTQSPSGEPIETWTTLSIRPCSYNPLGGDERFNADQYVARQQVEFIIRFADAISDINPLDRIVFPASVVANAVTGNLYDIMAVDEINRRDCFRVLSARRADVLEVNPLLAESVGNADAIGRGDGAGASLPIGGNTGTGSAVGAGSAAGVASLPSGVATGSAAGVGAASGAGQTGSGLAPLTAPIRLVTIGHSRQAYNDFPVLDNPTAPTTLLGNYRRYGNATWLLFKNKALQYISIPDFTSTWGTVVGLKSLQTNSINTTLNSPIVTLGYGAPHGLLAGRGHQVFMLDVLEPLAGLVLNGKWFDVLTVPDSTHITFDAGANANATLTNTGGVFFQVLSAGDASVPIAFQGIRGANAGSAADHSEGTLDMMNVGGGRSQSGKAVTMEESVNGIPHIVWIDAHGNDINSHVDVRVSKFTMKAVVAKVKARWPDARIVLTDEGRQVRQTGIIPDSNPFTTTAGSATVTVRHSDHDRTDNDYILFNRYTSPGTLPQFSCSLSGSALTGLTITDPGSGLTNGVYNLTFMQRATINQSAYGTVTVSGGQAVSAVFTNAGTGFTVAPKPPDINMTVPLVVNGIDMAQRAWAIPVGKILDGDRYQFTAGNVASGAGSGGGSGINWLGDPVIGWGRTLDGEDRWDMQQDIWADLKATYAADPLVRCVELPSLYGTEPDIWATAALMTRDGAHWSDRGGHAIGKDVHAAIADWIDNTTASFETNPLAGTNLALLPGFLAGGGGTGAGGTGATPIGWTTIRALGTAHTWTGTLVADGAVNKLQLDIASAAGLISESVKLTPPNYNRTASGTLTTPFRTVAASPIVTVVHNAHGLLPGAVVTFTGGITAGGLNMNGTWTVLDVIASNQYRFTHSSNATTTVTTGAGNSGNPGYSYDATNLWLADGSLYEFGFFYEQSAWAKWRGIEANIQTLAGATIQRTYFAARCWSNDYNWWPSDAMQGANGLWVRSNPFPILPTTTVLKLAINPYFRMDAGGGTGTCTIGRPYIRKIT
jgi:head-tail adaptor